MAIHYPKRLLEFILRTTFVIACLALAGCQGNHSAPPEEVLTKPVDHHAPTTQHVVHIQLPPLPKGVISAPPNVPGVAVVLQCQACHGIRPANHTTFQSSELDEFHQGLNLAHGKLTCVSCHNPSDGYSTLRLADGRSLPFAESMQLCAQCHGTQFRDYQHGSHGGMTGHWDLTKGGRTRNHCLHCHDPHAPQYPQFLPAAGPRDRFRPAHAGEHHE